MNKNPKISADDIVELHREKVSLEERLESIKCQLRDYARELSESGGEMTSSDGYVVSYTRSPKRTIVPEMVEQSFPAVWKAIAQEQMASFKPRLTMSALSRHMAGEDIDKVVIVQEQERVSVKEVRQ